MADDKEHVRADLKQLAHDQMGRWERMNSGRGRKAIADIVAEDEHVDLIFGAQIDGKDAALAFSERRVLAGWGGLYKHTATIDYQSITQVGTGSDGIELSGSGVSLTAAVFRRDEFLKALDERRRATSAAEAPPPAAAPTDDPMALIEHLGVLKEKGLLTDEEFAAKKAELLDRM
jgi:hypothetical protein